MPSTFDNLQFTKLNKIDELWNSANSLFKWIFSCHPEILLPWQRDVTIFSSIGIKQNEPDSHDSKRL